jgi:hypothetical protein
LSSGFAIKENINIRIYKSVILSQLSPRNEDVGHEVPKWPKRRIEAQENMGEREREKTDK